MHIQAYFSIFTLIIASKANYFNKYSNCCWCSTLALLLSPADSSHSGCSQQCWTVRQWKVPLQQARDPGFLMPPLLHVFAESLFCLVAVLMCNLPESVQFALELCVLSLVHWRRALPRKDWWKEPKWRLALTADGRSGVSVLSRPRDLIVPLLLLQLGQW